MVYTNVSIDTPPPEGDTVASRQYVSLLIANVVQQQNAESDLVGDSVGVPDPPVSHLTAHWDDPDAIMYEDDDEAMA